MILFDQLDQDHVVKIVTLELNKFTYRMEEEGYSFKFTSSAKEFLAKEGYDPKFGARPVKEQFKNTLKI